MIKYSIIIPIYNAEKYLDKCLNSLLNQTYSNIEILLINDGSTDKSLEICMKYQSDERVKIINKKNGGVSSSRNAGIKKASGDYITFLDADDYIENNTFEIINAIILKKNIDILKYGYYKVFNKIKIKYKFNVSCNEIIEKKDFNVKIIPHIFNTNDFGNVWNMVIKSNIAKKIKFDEEKRFAEDRKYAFDILFNSDNIYILDLPLYNYIFNSESAMNKKNYETSYRQLLDVFDTTYYMFEISRKKYEIIKFDVLNCVYFNIKIFLMENIMRCSYNNYLNYVNNVFEIETLKILLNKLDEYDNSYNDFISKKMFFNICYFRVKNLLKKKVKGFIGQNR